MLKARIDVSFCEMGLFLFNSQVEEISHQSLLLDPPLVGFGLCPLP